MRGSPLIRALIAFIVLAGAAPLLWRMTATSSQRVQSREPVADVKKNTVSLALTFSAPAQKIIISHLGSEIWEKDAPETEEECVLEVPWPAEGGELLFKITWPASTPLSAMRATLTDPADMEIERSLWGRGEVEKVLRFP